MLVIILLLCRNKKFMHLEKIEIRHIKMELVTPFSTSMGTENAIEHLIIRIDAEGMTGWGECVAGSNPYYTYETVQTAWHILQDFLILSVLGKEISMVDDVKKIFSPVRGHRMAKAGIETAIWDLFAKAKGISLSKMIGGVRDKIDVGVSIGIQSSLEELINKVDSYLKEGYRRIKIKISPGNDIQFVKAFRKEFPDILLQVDANSAYSLKDINLFKEIDNYNLLLIEQPLGYEDIYEHSKLQREIKTPICLDESIHSLDDTRAAIELDSCRVINIKPGRVGGFTESKLIHDYCASKNIPVWCGGMLESGIGRAGNIALASLSNFTLPGDISASKRYYKEDIIEPEFVLNDDGTIDVPTNTGIGVDVNIEKLDKVTVRKESLKL
jgi:o-succinylbenzoate synthase